MEDNKKTAVEVVDIQFRPGQKIYYFSPNGLTFKQGDHVIIDTARGPEFGIVAGGNHTIPGKDVVSPLRSVLRKASTQDERIVEENRAKEKKAYDVCLQKIADHLEFPDTLCRMRQIPGKKEIIKVFKTSPLLNHVTLQRFLIGPCDVQ